MASPVESIEIIRFDPTHPVLSPEPKSRPFTVKSVGVFAVLWPDFGHFVAVCQGQSGWSIPAGRMEKTDPDPVSVAIREFREETEGFLVPRDITHMGIVLRKTPEGQPVYSLVFRAKINKFNFGINHEIRSGQIIGIGDQEVTFMAFTKALPPPIYRPEINIPVIRAFSQIKG